ncbi:unnamed protein product [Scytosiphon promiscuus]
MIEEAEVQPAGDSKSKFELTAAEVADDEKAPDLEPQSGIAPLVTQTVEITGIESSDKALLGSSFDVDPRDPAVIVAFLVGVVCLVATVWLSRRRRRGRSNGGREGGGNDGDGGTAVQDKSAPIEPLSSPVASPHNTRRRRVTTTPGSSSKSRASPSKVVILSPPQMALCEVLYDVYGGTVPSRGIETKAVQESGLSTAEIRRQFKKIKQAREGNAGSASPYSTRRVIPAPSPAVTRSSPSRSSIRRTDGATKHILKSGGKLTSRIPPPTKRTASSASRASAGAASPKKPPASPRKTPVKRGAASRPTLSSPKSGGAGGGKRAAKRTASSSPSTRGRSTASVLPSTSQPPSSPGSPMQTRGKNRTPSMRLGSPKSTPTKRAAPAAVASPAGSGGGGTPSKRGKPESVLEIARREAQEQAAKIASTRASTLRAHT